MELWKPSSKKGKAHEKANKVAVMPEMLSLCMLTEMGLTATATVRMEVTGKH